MSSVSDRTWGAIRQIHEDQRLDQRIEQQALFRLFEAVRNEDSGLATRLADQGAPLDGMLWKDGEAAHPLAAEMFPPAYPYRGLTPVGWAALTGNVKALTLLESLGADLWTPVESGRDALWLASLGVGGLGKLAPRSTAGPHVPVQPDTFQAGGDSNHVLAWDWLYDRLPDWIGRGFWNAQAADRMHRSRLQEAVLARALPAVQAIAPKADLSAVDREGRTALHLNLLQTPYTDDDQAIGRLLVQYGAPPRQQDHEGISPAALAQEPAQKALIDNAVLLEITHQEYEAAQALRAERDAEPTREPGAKDPSEPDFAQINRPPVFKRPPRMPRF